MRSRKIKEIDELGEIIRHHRATNKKVALITGCFDVLHMGHIKLFRFAKKHADIVVVGLDSDISITKSKGKDRPVNKIVLRKEQISELESVDYVFEMKIESSFSKDEMDTYHSMLYQKIAPDYLVTNPIADPYWKRKLLRAQKYGIKLLKDTRGRISASSYLIRKILEKEL